MHKNTFYCFIDAIITKEFEKRMSPPEGGGKKKC